MIRKNVVEGEPSGFRLGPLVVEGLVGRRNAGVEHGSHRCFLGCPLRYCLMKSMSVDLSRPIRTGLAQRFVLSARGCCFPPLRSSRQEGAMERGCDVAPRRAAYLCGRERPLPR